MRHPGTIDDVDDARRRLRDTRRALYESNGYRHDHKTRTCPCCYGAQARVLEARYVRAGQRLASGWERTTREEQP